MTRKPLGFPPRDRRIPLRRVPRRPLLILLGGVSLWVFSLLLAGPAWAQTTPKQPAPSDVESAAKTEAASTTPDKVEVKPLARDDEIKARLTKILEATGWFQNVDVSVNEGVVFLNARTQGEALKKWAGDLAHSTTDVVAVVNQIEVNEPLWDVSLLSSQLSDLSRAVISGLPTLAFALLILPLAWLLSRLITRGVHHMVKRSLYSELLRGVFANFIGAMVFLIAVYLVLRVAGLTQLALTLVGGTGLLGLALGIAFKDITENFLASIYLSLQKPFEPGDLVEVTDLLGYVQRVTARTTVLMNLEGNYLQIPNATVFKNTIRNFTSNPNRRDDFVIGIGFEASIPVAQEIALQVLREHPAVLQEPEPWVLVDGLGNSTVDLRVYFWLDGKQHSWLKVRSALIRLIKRAFQDADVTLPDESREIVFPHGVPVRMVERPADHGVARQRHAQDRERELDEPQLPSSSAEGGLSSDAPEIEQQAKHARMPEAGENLLRADEQRPAVADPPAAEESGSTVDQAPPLDGPTPT